MQVKNHKLKARLVMRMAFLALCTVLFAGTAKAQVYMHNGEQYLSTNSSVKFYDSGGASKGPDNYWLHWYGAGQDYTFTFYPETAGNAIKVEFGDYVAYTDNGNYNHNLPGKYTLRLNDTWLYVYEGNAVDDTKLITAFTGTVVEPFTMMANGPITFRFYSVGGHTEEGWDATVTAVAGSQYGLQKPVISKQVCTDDIVLNPTTFGAQVRYTTTGSNPTVSSTLYENPFQINYTSTGTTVKAICVNGSNVSDYAEKLFKDTDATPTPRALVAADIVRQENTIIITPPAVPDGINETYGIIYTTGTHGSTVADPVYNGYGDPNNEGTYLAPDPWNGSMPGKIHFEWLTPNTDIKIAVVAQSCVKQSDNYTYYFEKLQIPTPTIVTEVVNTTDYTGKATISFADGYTMRYTTDGSTPIANLSGNPITTSPWTVNDLTPGTTVKVIVYKVTNNAIDESYEPAYASALYLPGEGQSGSYGGLVILNDLEPHSWSYYSDATNPVRSLKPVDVKITYNGNGTGNMTSSSQNGDNPTAFAENATGVKVGIGTGDNDESQSSFMYLKTLERADGNAGTGRCAYQVIPNPFSVRPISGTYSNNFTGWRGFYRWRLKSISGGSVYTAASGGTALVAGTATIDAETTLYFEPSATAGDDDMIEVVFEALWAQAYLATSITSNTLNANVSYERNFVRTTNNVGGNNNVNTRPATIMSIYPNGTTNGTTAATLSNVSSVTLNTFSCSADTKFEYINLSGNNNVTAGAHKLCFGRGISTSNTAAARVQGNAAGNFTMRLESGKYTAAYGFYSSSQTTALTANIIFGNDYDRAKGTNTNLYITNLFEVGHGSRLSSASAKVNVVALSGTFGASGDDHELYMGFQGVGENSCLATRSLEVLGGNFLGGIAGGIEYNVSASTEILKIRIKGGTIHQYLYGSGQFAAAYGTRRFVITGGTFDAWVAGGCYGTDQSGNNGPTDGDSYIYFGGKANMTNTDGVFGGGYGRGNAGDNKYTINKSFVVVADEATIAGNVYGGGNKGYNTDDAEVYVLGVKSKEGALLSIAGSVFGGANQARSEAKTTVTMKDGTVGGSLYGGANASGAVAELATVKMQGGTVTNVYGGGLGSATEMSSGTVVNVTGGAINNNVYGGGEEGTVTGNTNVTISGGTMNDVYGAGKGSSSQDANISGKTYVTVTKGTMANVYGGGENGTVDEGNGGGNAGGTLTFDFEDGTTQGWTTIDADTHGNAWSVIENSYYFTYSHGGDCCMRASYNSSYAHQDYLVSPQIILGGSVSFYARKYSSSYNDTFRVYLSTSGNTNASDFTVELTSGNVNPGTSYSQYTYDLSSYSGTGYIAIVYTAAANQYYLFVDDITIEQPENAGVTTSLASTVTISGGTVSTDVFGGGKLGTTNGNTIVNIKGDANVGQHVYGGALGEQGSVYVAGTHTVNVLGGYVHGNVYGGSRNANDALTFDPGNFKDNNGNIIATEDQTVCAVNISAGHIGQQVYAAGFFGNCFGSVYAFVGQNAIYNAPDAVETSGRESAGEAYTIGNLYIEGSVWAGGDWGTFTDQFGAATISGMSNVYIDGLEYNTATTDKNNVNYMCIDGSVYGSGTSCDAGNKQHTVMLRNYGESLSPFETATRNFASIQRADHLVLDNVHVVFQGQGRINSLNVTEVYAMYWITDDVIVTGGSTLIMEAPADQMKSFISASCGNVFTAALPTSETNLGGYTALLPSTVSATPNKVRVNGGNYIKVYYDEQIASGTAPNITYTPGYGMLKGYAYMMAAGNNVATCAYARPRWETNAPFAQGNTTYDNPNDGGWVSYISTDNTFALDGSHGTGITGVQMAYENHTPRNGEGYFRIWRTTGELHEREGVFDVLASGTDAFKYVDVEIELPAWRGTDYYYKFNTSGDGNSTDIDYGPEVMTFNSALYATDAWLSYNTTNKVQQLSAITEQQNFIKQNPNLNYGLVIMEVENGGAELSSPAIDGTDAPGLIICEASDEFLAKKTNGVVVNKFTNSDNTVIPTVKFRLTFSDQLSTNKTYEPMYVTLVQCDANGDVTDQVRIKLVVNTSTVVGRDFTENIYAVMNGNGSTADEAHVQIVLPRFNLQEAGVESKFTVESITWTPATLPDHGNVTIGNTSYPTSGSGELSTVSGGNFNPTNFAMEFKAADNYDGTTGWEELNPTVYDTKEKYGEINNEPTHTMNPALVVGHTGGRTQFSFDFGLYYNGQVELDNVTAPELMGTIVYNMKFTNYGTAAPYETTFKITLNVYRRGQGTRYYLDGVNGQNAYDGTKPDRAMYTLAGLFNRGGSDHKGILPGDDVYVVNQVTVNDELEWNGLTKGGNVNIYRYNGGHPLYDAETGIIGNSGNTAYTGNLVKVVDGGSMIMRGITMDGYYRTAKDEGTTVTSASPLVTIENGGTLELNQKVTLQKNYNTNNGGAVVINNGGTLMMNQDASIKDNLTDGEGAGVYMNGTMIASDEVKVWDNKKGNDQNNVYLADKTSVLQIGVDKDNANYKDLSYDAENPDESAKIGLSKSTTNFVAGVAEVVYSKETSWLTKPLNTQAIIVHDGNIYKLETGESANKLYWRDTWVTFQNHQPTADEGGWDWNGTDNEVPISTERQLAWFISLVNGENGQTASNFSGKTIVIKSDLDMKDHTWVPIGERTNVFKGTFEGNGHVIEGLNCSLNRTDIGMFGITDGAIIQNVVAKVSFDGVANNVGSIAGTMKDGIICNVEAAGELTGDAQYTKLIGGVVGKVEKGTVHSAFAVNTMTAQNAETVMGGLVAENAGNLFNSYSNVTFAEGSTNTSGLVGINTGMVQNCYNASAANYAFAYQNQVTVDEVTTLGKINFCYAAPDVTSYVGTDAPGTLAGHGNYSNPLGRKAIGYLYDDNKVSLASGQSNTYVATAISYNGGKIDKWPGMVSTLNQWVKVNPLGIDDLASWLRPTTNAINGDLPVLAFAKDNAMGSASADDKFLRYSAYDLTAGDSFDNGIDGLLTTFNKGGNIFLYNNATNVENVPGESTYVFINEDAVLLQKQGTKAGEFINTTVGVTFDNSDHGQHAVDNQGNVLTYDWHMMSSSLSNAILGTSYGDATGFGNPVNITSMVNNYFPNGLPMGAGYNEGVKWDFYSYSEPNYHWINLKRSDHYHIDGGAPISYTNETTFTPGKGYMMAISQDSYMSSTGTLNNGNVPITITNQEPESIGFNKGWNLVGNPYQAYLNLYELGSLGYKAYTYDADQGLYIPFVMTASDNTSTLADCIHPHQAFFVYCSTVDGQETLTFKPSMATTENKVDYSYFRGDKVNYPLVNIYAENERGNRDMTIIEFNRPEIGGAEEIQGLRNANFHIAASLDGQGYGLLFAPEGTDRVPVRFYTHENGTFTLTWETMHGNFTSLLLVDNMTGTITDMLRSDHYTFDATIDDYASRFYITFTVTDVEEYNEGEDFAWFDGSEWVINGKGNLDVVDVLGRTIYSTRLTDEQNRVNLNGMAKGVYLLRVSEGNKAKVQKVVVR